MAEDTNQTAIDAAELATLRTTVSELKQKNATRKKRIAELESALAQKESELATASASLRAATIDQPLRDMSQSISTAPDAWIENFNKSYRLEMKDGSLSLLTTDGKPVHDKDGKDLPFSRETLIALTTDEKHSNAALFRAITIISKASGGNSAPESGQRKASTPPQKPFQFGLRNPSKSN